MKISISKKQAAIHVVAFLVFLLSILNVTLANKILTWQLSIPTREYGLLFAILALLFWIWTFKNKVPWNALIIAIPFFLSTSIQAARHPLSHHIYWFELLTVGKTSGLKVIEPETVTFKTRDGVESYYDVYKAVPASDKVIVVVHGGGWANGDRTQIPEWNWYLAQNGWNVIAPTYRLAPKSIWPTQPNDVRDAIADARKNESLKNFDWKTWAIFGRSAGGQLAGEVGFTDKELPPKSVISFYAPTDLEFGYEVADDHDILDSRNLLANYYGGHPSPETIANYRDSSPLNHVTKDTPDTLMIHGTEDMLTWYKHSERLTRRMLWAGAKPTLVILPWSTHGFEWSLSGLGGQIAKRQAIEFLNRNQ